MQQPQSRCRQGCGLGGGKSAGQRHGHPAGGVGGQQRARALKVELLYAQAMLDNTQGREIHSPALKELLLSWRIAPTTCSTRSTTSVSRTSSTAPTYHAADAHAGGCVRDLILNARHVAGAVAAKLKPSCGSRHGHTIGEHDEQDRHGCLSSVVCSARVAGARSAPHRHLPPTRMSRIRSMADACTSWLPTPAPLHVPVSALFISSRAGRLPVSVDNCVHTLTYPRFPTQQEMDEDSSPVLPCLPR
jgi:hypothetical protein